MLIEGIPYREYVIQRHLSRKNAAILNFLEYLERKMGILCLSPTAGTPEGKVELIEPFAVARTLMDNGIIKSLRRAEEWPDEPQLNHWQCTLKHGVWSTTAGMSLDDPSAIYAALAGGLERYLWLNEYDYFEDPVSRTAKQMASGHTSYLQPDRFVENFNLNADLQNEQSFVWVRGTSLTDGSKIYIPAQSVSGAYYPGFNRKHIITERTTSGLATWPTQEGARLRGILERVEHDAYMIMWLNQLILPRIGLDNLISGNKSLADLVERCVRYRLRIHAIRMLTDAPTNAVCVIVEDMSGTSPRFTVGLKAHRSMTACVESATLEALRARRSYRTSAQGASASDQETPVIETGQKDQIFDWSNPHNAKKLESLISGNETTYEEEVWKTDSEGEHLRRLLDWCRAKAYPCISVAVGQSKSNPTKWHVERIIMPDLHPLHSIEKQRVTEGSRLRDIPLQFGKKPLDTVFTTVPHPFY